MKRVLFALLAYTFTFSVSAQVFNAYTPPTQKPPLHGKNWMAITGKPLAATAGAMTFQKGGNAVDAACAMIAATSTMWDVLSWGGETQAMIYNPNTKKVIAINALGVAPTGATPEYFKGKGLDYIPEYGPLAAVTPGTPGGIMVMLAEYGTMSLKEVLAPAMELAAGYPIEAQTANAIERGKSEIKKWPYSTKVFLTHPGEEREAPEAGEIFVQKDLLAMLTKLVETEQAALKKKKSRKEAIYAAYDRFYKGDIAKEIARGTQEQGGLITEQDLANWEVKIEEPMMVNYKGIDVYKLSQWTQGPALLQSLNMLENFDLKAMGYNSSKYIHTLYQVMSMAFSDRDFYYGDPYFGPEEPMKGILSKEYAKERVKQINWEMNDAKIGPGDPYPFEGKVNPYSELLKQKSQASLSAPDSYEDFMRGFLAGTTSVQTADKNGWVVSVTPSGGWIPACIAGNTGIGLSQRMQSFVLNEEEGPFNVVAPGKRPRVTLTPSMALKDGKPFLSFAVQGGDTQDQNLLQMFLNVVEFDMTIQEAVEAANINSYQVSSSFGNHESIPGSLLLRNDTPPWVQKELIRMGYKLRFDDRSSGPINAIYFDWKHGSFWGGSSNYGEDYGIGW
ncbi:MULTISPECIES: gamma-glutamyltransferase family protein [unclassified Imperialibacter]|uniref:gamma-glutamyltransferase family protein n=1 Tax=unclassified Imperialibacter TaxID=2629706 RepID=UPI001251EA71|nr:MULTISPECIES: gamma-glutamyltransferase [unclassified Imperialibacter]CAD5256701.1 Gamma-glutamyltransferase [Imperialibacter sp. 89]CAD5271689.1 Gamma-glutamyltransferase [Imperialibacter sp. 75]VVT19200.1 Gamma-glutamyltransferase [Imperialibacter sp. EC-SDR9]